MGILKCSNVVDKTNEKKVVGVVLTGKVYTYFSLFATTKGCTKATIIRELMKKWWEHKNIKEPENKLIETLTKKIQSEWDSLKLKVPEKDFYEFFSELKQELVKKGLHKMHINLILNKIIK